MKIIHISDLHYRASKAIRTKSLVKHIINHYAGDITKPVVVISGDLVESPREERMIQCFEILKLLKEAGHDILICPGNHDVKYTRSILGIKIHGSAYSQLAPKEFSKIFSPLLPEDSWDLPNEINNLLNFPKVNKYGKYYFIGLDSNNEENFPSGTIGTDQLDSLDFHIDRIKSESDDNKIILYFHHNLYWFDPGVIWGRKDGNWLRLTDRYDLRNLIKNKVDAVMFGHYHVNKNYSTRTESLGSPLLQLAGNCTHSSNHITWFEFDMEANKITPYERPIE